MIQQQEQQNNRGHRPGFLLGALLGIGGSLVCAFALHQSLFIPFVIGHFLLGGYQGFANYTRFAAVEAAGPEHASKAISLVVAGGVVAAFLGPQLGQWGPGSAARFSSAPIWRRAP